MNFITIGAEIFQINSIINIYTRQHVTMEGNDAELVIKVNPYQLPEKYNTERTVYSIGRSTKRLNHLFLSEVCKRLNDGETHLTDEKLDEIKRECKNKLGI